MAHEVETMTYTGEVPWHGLGTPLPEEGLRDWKVACKAAGLDWLVDQKPLFFYGEAADGDGRVTHGTTHRANVRSSDGQVVGIVGPDYKVLQNCEAFEWFAPFLETGEVTIESAGSLRHGTRIWALAKIDAAIEDVRQADPVQRYVLLSHSHDGSLSVRAGVTDIRVVCHNTLSQAHALGNGKLIRIRHTKNVKENLELVRQVLDASRAGFFASIAQYKRLARKDINQDDVRRYVELVFEVDRSNDVPTITQKRVDHLVELATTGMGNLGRSLWDAFNAITQYTSWERGRTEDARMNSVWFGDSAKLNSKALEVAEEMAAA